MNTEEVLKRTQKGPFGLGDPEDMTLLDIERVRIIPIYMRNIIAQDYCFSEENEYNNCSEGYKWTKRLRCYQQVSSLKSCLKKYWHLPQIKSLAEQEYLKERSMYRLTGLRKSERNDKTATS